MDFRERNEVEPIGPLDDTGQAVSPAFAEYGWRYLGQVAILAALYFMAGKFGLLLVIPPGYASPLWPSAGIALAALLLFGYRLWPGIVVGSFLVNFGTAFDASSTALILKSPVLATGIGVGAALQAMVGTFLVRRYAGFSGALTEVSEIIRLLTLGGPISCVISATVGMTTLLIGDVIPWADYWFSWCTWWAGDTIGVLIVTPLVLIWIGKPRQVWHGRWIAVATPVCVALGTVITLFIYVHAREQNRIKLEFEQRAVIVANAFSKTLEEHLQILYSIESLFASSEKVTRQEFRRFVERHLARHSGIQTLSWNLRVPGVKRVTYEGATRRDGYRDFEISERDAQGRLYKAARRPEYVSVQYIEPHKGNEQTLGFDVASDLTHRAALSRARDTGAPTAIAQTSLIQETSEQPNILVFLPIYSNQQPHGTVTERRQALQGYVAGVFRIGDLLETSLVSLKPANTEVWLYDDLGEGQNRLLYVCRPGGRQSEEALVEGAPGGSPAGLQWTTTYDFAGHQWTLRLFPTAGYVAVHRSWAPWTALAGGLLLTSLLGTLQLILTGRSSELLQINSDLKREIAERRRAEEEVVRLTRDLKERLDELQVLFEVAPVGIAVAQGPECQHITVNPAGAKMLGVGREENISKSGPTSSCLPFRVLRDGRELAPDELPMQYAATHDVAIRDLELSIVHDNGRVLTLFEYASPLHDEYGNVRGCLGVFVDITERKQTEQALFAEKERAQVTLHSIGDAVITTDAQGVVEYLNPIAEALTGWPVTEAQGQPLTAVFHIVTEKSHEHASNPVARCLREDQIGALGNQSILINRYGQEYAIQDSAAPIRDREGNMLGTVLVFHDVSEARRTAQQMAYRAAHDTLTGLVNRHEFEQRLAHAVASSKEYNACHALCYLDLDQFKIVNDTAGHVAGDELLRQIAGLLRNEIRERDTLARLGGDEFGLLLDHCPLAKALEIAEALVAAVCEFRFSWEGRTFQIGVSIGLVPITAKAENAMQILTQADVACYTAKDLGRNQVYIYQLEDGEPVRRHFEIHRAAELQEALEQNRFCLYCQPIVSLSQSSNGPIGYELLIRLLDVKGEIIPPGAFIPAAERYGLMGTLDRWVIRTAFRRHAELFGNSSAGPMIAINLSGNSLNDDRLLDFVHQQFAECAIMPERICFEITETAAIYDLSRTTQFITVLKNHGCHFALDDFGSGFSSFTYLKKLPIDFLKIDGSFVRDMADDPIDHAMVAAINQVGHVMGIRTIAEYAESQTVLEQLQELGVDYAQGYALGNPRPLEEIGAATV